MKHNTILSFLTFALLFVVFSSCKVTERPLSQKLFEMAERCYFIDTIQIENPVFILKDWETYLYSNPANDLIWPDLGIVLDIDSTKTSYYDIDAKFVENCIRDSVIYFTQAPTPALPPYYISQANHDFIFGLFKIFTQLEYETWDYKILNKFTYKGTVYNVCTLIRKADAFFLELYNMRNFRFDPIINKIYKSKIPDYYMFIPVVTPLIRWSNL